MRRDQRRILGKIGSNREARSQSLNMVYGFYGIVMVSHDFLHPSSLDMKLQAKNIQVLLLPVMCLTHSQEMVLAHVKLLST